MLMIKENKENKGKITQKGRSLLDLTWSWLIPLKDSLGTSAKLEELKIILPNLQW
jgi:hypothetical protein